MRALLAGPVVAVVRTGSSGPMGFRAAAALPGGPRARAACPRNSVLRPGKSGCTAPLHRRRDSWPRASYDPSAVSGAGARGLMQVMPETGGLDRRQAGPDPLRPNRRCWNRMPAFAIGRVVSCAFSCDRYGGRVAPAPSPPTTPARARVDAWLTDRAPFSADGKTLSRHRAPLPPLPMR